MMEQRQAFQRLLLLFYKELNRRQGAPHRSRGTALPGHGIMNLYHEKDSQ